MDDPKIPDKQLVSKEDLLLMIQQILTNPNQKTEPAFIDEQKNTFKIDPTDLEKIEKIVSKNNKFFADKDAFIREAIDMMSKFWDGPFEELNEKMKHMWQFLPQETKSYIDQTSPEYYRQMEMIPMNEGQAAKSFEEIQKKNSDVKNFLRQYKNLFKNLDRETFDKETPALIGRPKNSLLLDQDYARIFPTKLVLMLLAYEIYQAHNSTQATWISYKKFRESVYDDVRVFTMHVKNNEKEIFNKKSRSAIIKTRKISIGLPFVDPQGSIKNVIREKSSKNIFLDTYVGSTLRAWQKTRKQTHKSEDGQIGEIPLDSGYMIGILSELNLIAFKPNRLGGFENDIDVTLTPAGCEFLMIKNPILDENNFERSLSIQEGEYYIDVLIQNHKLEKNIINRIRLEIDSLNQTKIPEKSNNFDDERLPRHMITKSMWMDEDTIQRKIEALYQEYEITKSRWTGEKFLSTEHIEILIILELLRFSPENCNSEEKKFLDSKRDEIQSYAKDIAIKTGIDTPTIAPGEYMDTYEELRQRKSQSIFKKSHDWMQAYRISLMGRLSESGLVRWEIEDNDSRYYSSKMIMNVKGVALDKLGKYEESITWHNKGAALGILGKYEKSIKCYDKALEIDPNDVFAITNKGDALDNLGRYEEAITCYDKALEIKPNYGNAINNKGVALDNLDRY